MKGGAKGSTGGGARREGHTINFEQTMRAGEADKNNPPHSWERGGLDGILSPPYVIRGRKGMQWHTKLNRLQGASFSVTMGTTATHDHHHHNQVNILIRPELNRSSLCRQRSTLYYRDPLHFCTLLFQGLPL